MISRRSTIALVLLVVLAASSIAGDKSQARLEKLGDLPQHEIRVRHSLSAADTCIVSHHSAITWRITGWVTGLELYKSLMDPAASCENPYPYTITEINMPMMFDDATPLTVAVDVESVDYTTNPGCPAPGVVLALSQDYELQVPAGGGFYNVWIPLDEPFVVNEPFFAGFYIGNAIEEAVAASVVTDSVPATCVNYNIWEGADGWIDLGNNTLFNFPGRLVMEVSGIPGGGSLQPAPQLVLTSPAEGEVLLGTTQLWAYDSSGSEIIDYVAFEYSDGSSFVEIGRDYDGHRTLRDGVTESPSGAGYSFDWDPRQVMEGAGTLRVTAYDTLGRVSEQSVSVYVEPTPPIPRIVSPHDGDDICPPITLIMNSGDNNMSFVEMYRKAGKLVYSASATPMSQDSVGDNNGNPSDGNLVINGEFGPYYCGPVAATIALKIWADRGISGLFGASNPMTSVAETIAEYARTRTNLGTYDELLLQAISKYSQTHGDYLEFDFQRNPNYYRLRNWVEGEERAVMLGLSGNPSLFVTVDGFDGWNAVDENHIVAIANPITGLIENCPMRDMATYSEIQVNGNWLRIDIMISALAKSWSPVRTALGIDLSGADGWSFQMAANGMSEDSLYFVRADGRDASMYRGNWTILVRNNCSDVYTAGDYDNDGITDLNDALYLIDFLTGPGQVPVGGIGRADANCDGYVNIVDVVYFLNFLFGSVAPPCH